MKDAYVLSGLLSFIANVSIGLFVLSRNPQANKNIRFCLFSSAVACWSAGSFLVNIIPDPGTALAVLRGNYFFGVWTPALYVHFIDTFNRPGGKTRRNRVKFFYAGAFLFSFLVFTPFFIPSLRAVGSSSFWISRPGPFYYLFFIYFSAAMGEVILRVFDGLKTRSGLELRQYRFLAIANLLAVTAGFEYFLGVFGFFSRPPLDDYILIADVAILAYAVTRHRLFDVDALVKAFRKERLATLGLLASSIHHEIKNPLYMIKGLLENGLEKEALLRDPQQVRSLLEKAHMQAGRIFDLMNRYNRLFKDPAPANAEAVESAFVEPCLEYALQVMALIAQGKKLEILQAGVKDLPPVLIKPGELEEVLVNLLINACQALPENGRIEISAGQKGKNVRLVIRDNGPGIPSGQLKKIFTPFHSTKGGKGAGLGLYITKEILERRGGKISVKSKAGEGACFEIELPEAL